jgi:hypothetical protein
MTRWQAVYRWVGAVLAVGLLLASLILLFGRGGDDGALTLGPAQRRINAIVDLGDDGAASCVHDELSNGEPAPQGTLRTTSTACVLVGVVDEADVLRWFFIGRGAGDGTVRVPRPVEVGQTVVALSNGAVVSIGERVAVRCSPDPNLRFETVIAEGLATAGYLDASGSLVAIGCDSGQ